MNNLVPSRSGFKHDHVLSNEGNKSKIIRLEVSYLKSFSGKKGVLVTITPKEVEQCEGYCTETLLLYNAQNISVWAKMLTRKSDKEVLAMAEKLDPSVLAILTAYLESPERGREAILQAVAPAAVL
jgi:hypothetical protein